MLDPVPRVHTLTGGCLCGGVRFELTAPPPVAGYCHCTRCQRRTGTGSSLQARIDGRTLRLLQGEALVKAWRHPDGGFEKLFCGECAGHLFSRNPDDHTQMSVRMGAFDGDPGVRASALARLRRLRRPVGADPGRRAQALRRGQGVLVREFDSGDFQAGSVTRGY